MTQPESRQMTSNLLRLAIHLGQPLASREPSPDWFRLLVEAVVDISGSEFVNVYFSGEGDLLYMRASWQPDEPVDFPDSVATDAHCLEAYNTQTVIFSDAVDDDATIYLPIRYQASAVGVLQVTTLEESAAAFTVLEALDVLISFAACGFVHQMSSAGQPQSASQRLDYNRAKALSELSTAVAHQINNPLTTVLADTEILLLDTDPDSRAYQSLLAIARAGRRAADVARRLMSVAGQEKLEAPRRSIDILESIENALQLVDHYIQRDNITIVKDYPDAAPLVMAAPGVLDDVWLNLLMNAREALKGHKDPQIAIDVTHDVESGKICVNIIDNGVGLPDVAWEHLFEPFFTVKSSAAHMGLGLHICRQIVEQVGGTIGVADTDADTCFVVCLPVDGKGT